MNGLALTLTDAGRAALINAQNNGTHNVLLAEIGVSATHFVADAETALLPDEIKRLTTFAGQTVASDTLHITLRDDSNDRYTLRSFALYLANGTLLAVYSQAEPILEKSSQSIVLLAVDIRLLQDQAALIQFGPADFMHPPASPHRPGVIELASDSQAIGGMDAERAITSFTLKIALDQRLAQHQQPWQRLTHIPASVHIPGQIIMFAGPQLPDGTLPCDGSQVLRNHYPALFAAIGTTYGPGDGENTFHLPHIAEGFALLNTHNANKVGTISPGEHKSHTHSATVSSDGTHAHSASSQAAGNHGHSASSGVAGQHTHHAWTDAQGQHTHTYTYYTFRWEGRGKGGGIYYPFQHSVQTSPAGHHAHNIGMHGNGAHSHPISIAANGQHAHEIAVAQSGQHSHSVTNAPSGNAHNLAAGLCIRCCIAY